MTCKQLKAPFTRIVGFDRLVAAVLVVCPRLVNKLRPNLRLGVPSHFWCCC